MLFVREDIPAKLIASETPPAEGLCGSKAKKAKVVDKLFS